MGLLAYALYKQSVREEAVRGATNASAARNPTSATVNAFRQAAEQRLTEVVNRAIEGATPDIQASHFSAQLESFTQEVISTVERRTSFGAAIWPNLAAWALTAIATVIIVLLLTFPGMEDSVRNRLDGLRNGQQLRVQELPPGRGTTQPAPQPPAVIAPQMNAS